MEEAWALALVEAVVLTLVEEAWACVWGVMLGTAEGDAEAWALLPVK